MAIAQLMTRQNAENGILAKHSKDFRFSIKRQKTGAGLFIYILENTPKNERLQISRELFDHFRSILVKIFEDFKRASNASHSPETDIKLFFADQDHFSFRTANEDPSKLLIKDLQRDQNSSGFMVISYESIETLMPLLYHPKLAHPNDIFDRIIQYHKLFQFSFTEGSESITSGLSLRRDVLSHIDEYIPSLGHKTQSAHLINAADLSKDFSAKTGDLDQKSEEKKAKFKSKLGQKGDQQGYTVDYDALFQSQQKDLAPKTPKAADDQTKRGATANATNFPLPLMASDIKAFLKTPFRCELAKDDVTILRESFLQDRESELYLGFEIMDAIYRSGGKLKTYRFPLYYMRVTIEESGRFVFIHPPKNGEVYLNHLALATLVETFGSARNGDPIERFFTTLLSQKIEIDGKLTGIKINRYLPFKEDVFDRTREVLLGLPDENGKGGILSELKLIGLECDLESVSLYKSAKIASPIARALEVDLEAMQEIAYENPKKFYRSLLGQFLTPELTLTESSEEAFFSRPLNPGALPKSTRKLFERLNQHDVVLLEGPPGTGKTFTIMNLFIHCVNTQKRLLIVSDQKAAIHALTEKVQEYLAGKEFHASHNKAIQSLYQQSIKIIDEVPLASPTLAQWMNNLLTSLKFESTVELDEQEFDPKFDEKLTEIDRKLLDLKTQIEETVQLQIKDKSGRRRLALKHSHPTTIEDIEDLVAFLEFIGAGHHSSRNQPTYYRTNQVLLETFLNDRDYLTQDNRLASCYDEFQMTYEGISDRIHELENLYLLLEDLISAKPRSKEEFNTIMAERNENSFIDIIYADWESNFLKHKSSTKKLIVKLSSYITHPSYKLWQRLSQIVSNQIKLVQAIQDFKNPERIFRQFQGIHQAIQANSDAADSLALEIIRYSQSHQAAGEPSIQSMLHDLSEQQARRDQLIKQRFLQCLSAISSQSMASDSKRSTNAITSLINLIEGLKSANSIDHGHGVTLLKELQEKLYETFPIWICRKQAVSFLFPSKEQIFDLIIVDEAGQCRVDDALPLLYRAKKIMVVGDEKQTVLDKNSVIDDYLFNEFNLEQHLQRTQARGIKGGGSNIFSLVKSIKQAGVMLDEHYRCPPEIIRYSNEYVYNNDLKIMQWALPSNPAAVVVDYSEAKAKSNKKPTSGKYKGIETEVIDRFLDFVAKTIKAIESETGQKINVETDAALCYFLLKNEVYIKDKKSEFLSKLNRGADILDGAGAALQGKERDYIFYLWDVNKTNMKSFRQGDDPDKRKGELNVLMSRPKRRAYHYLHPDFESLKHETASITDYLWKAYKRQSEKKTTQNYTPRTVRPGPQFRPWQRFSGGLMHRMLLQVWQHRHRSVPEALQQAQCSVEVGDPRHKVDLMLLDRSGQGASLGIIDLSGFEGERDSAQEIADYYFQLKRAHPKIEPVFVFLHELADERSPSYRILEKKILDWIGQQSSK